MAITDRQPAEASLWKKWAWFVGLWVAGVATVGIVAYALRLAIL